MRVQDPLTSSDRPPVRFRVGLLAATPAPLLQLDRSGSRRWPLGRRTLLLASPSVEVADRRLYTFVPGHHPVAHRPKQAAERVDAGVQPRADNPGLTALDTDGDRLAGYVGLESLQERLGENAEQLVDRGSASIV